ncbi:MAG: GerMN domain-containing protein [Ilumatobacteraceae bacterium]
MTMFDRLRFRSGATSRSTRGATRRISGLLAVVGVVLGVGVAGCGVPGSGGPERVDVGLGLDDTLPTTTTSTTSTTIVAASTTSAMATTTTIVATEDVSLFFISGGQLTPISLPLTTPTKLAQVMAALQGGTSQFGAPSNGLRSAIPLGVPAIEVTDDGNGIATVSLPVNFFDGIPSGDQRLAVAQVVLTLTQRGGIGQVRFMMAGSPIGVVLGSGEQSEPGRPVSRADYSVLLGGESTPPISPAPTTAFVAPATSDGHALHTTTTVGSSTSTVTISG